MNILLHPGSSKNKCNALLAQWIGQCDAEFCYITHYITWASQSLCCNIQSTFVAQWTGQCDAENCCITHDVTWASQSPCSIQSGIGLEQTKLTFYHHNHYLSNPCLGTWCYVTALLFIAVYKVTIFWYLHGIFLLVYCTMFIIESISYAKNPTSLSCE